MLKKLITNIDLLVSFFSSITRKELKEYSNLNTIYNDHIIVTNDGSLVSIFMIEGSKEVVTVSEMKRAANKIEMNLSSFFKEEGYKFQVVFSRDYNRVEDEIESIISTSRKKAKEIGLNLDNIFDGKKRELAKKCAYESAFIVCWTEPKTLSKEELSEEKELYIERMKKFAPFMEAQDIFSAYKSLVNKHQGFLTSVNRGFSNSQLLLSLLNVKTAIREIRKNINSDITSNIWTPVTPEDPVPLREKKHMALSEKDISDFLWPTLNEQIFPSGAVVTEDGSIKFGDKYISPMYFDLPPKKRLPFSQLFSSIAKEIPWQLSITVQSGGLKKAALKSTIASILSFTNKKNKLYKEAIMSLQLIEDRETIVSAKMDLLTWASNETELQKNKNIVIRAAQSWGSADVKFEEDDPIEGVLRATPAVNDNFGGSSFIAPLKEFLTIFPFSRQASIWKEGSVLFRTPDGKVFPYQPGSKEQHYWNDIIFATPGHGKSVLMNVLNLSALLQPGHDELPFVGIIDIGISSSGLIHLLKNLLPEDKKHLAIYKKLQNTKDFAINIFDTPLGSRKPNESDKFFMVNFITLLCTPSGKEAPASIDNMAKMVIDRAYERYSDKGEDAKEYTLNANKKIDKKLKELGFTHNEGTLWWNVVDFLFEKGEYEMATQAQTYAVPILSELTGIVKRDNSLKDIYSKPLNSETKESFIDFFVRSIIESVEQYPILASSTKFDIANARVVALDLNNVAKSGSEAAKKQTAIMYLLARNAIVKPYSLDADINTPEMLSNYMPPMYYQYYVDLATKYKKIKKRLCYDEFHKTEGVQAVLAQVAEDMREGRKWNKQNVMASQMLTDFSKDIIELSSGRFILSGGESFHEIVRKFDFSSTIGEIIRERVTGPEVGEGVPFVFNFETKKGSYTKFLMNTISPQELWAFTTTSEDMEARRLLANYVDDIGLAINILSKYSPTGTITGILSKIESKNNELGLNTNSFEELKKEIFDFADKYLDKFSEN